MEITHYTGGTLLTAPKMAAGVATGIADIGLSALRLFTRPLPRHGGDGAAPRVPERLDRHHVASDFYDKFKPKEWDQYQPLIFSFSPPCGLRPSTNPYGHWKRLKGLKIRGTGRIGDIVKALGATPMPIEMVDLYEVLEKGRYRRQLWDPLETAEGFQDR